MGGTGALRVLRHFISVCRMVLDIIRQHFERASGSGRRSTAVSTLIVMSGVLLAGLIGSLWAGAPEWLLQVAGWIVNRRFCSVWFCLRLFHVEEP